jgi:hypothetical protein
MQYRHRIRLHHRNLIRARPWSSHSYTVYQAPWPCFVSMTTEAIIASPFPRILETVFRFIRPTTKVLAFRISGEQHIN